ncbi:hypothetical protein [Paraburkholderia unamae]|uniref:hypothetical protein n=1 Tax=Paraburkholderia unamae TaxID=219649 RepID=UPI0011BECD7A|nr:hypothetical protein [Paraburkholderia unamae]
MQSLVCELDWCILHGDAGPRTTQAIESARAVLAALPSNSAHALATCSETLHNAIEQGNPLAAGVAVSLALLARERGFPGPDAPAAASHPATLSAYEAADLCEAIANDYVSDLNAERSTERYEGALTCARKIRERLNISSKH